MLHIYIYIWVICTCISNAPHWRGEILRVRVGFTRFAYKDLQCASSPKLGVNVYSDNSFSNVENHNLSVPASSLVRLCQSLVFGVFEIKIAYFI